MKRQGKIQTYGFLNIDKPTGITSSALVNKCKWLTGVPCGHMGTLDPLASGVLPVGVGNATRLFDYFLQKEKIYRAEFTFGVTSDTLDSTGDVVSFGHIPTKEEIESVIPTLLGEVMQIPPKYSAKNVNGRRGYELARMGLDFTLAPKKVHIYDVQIIGQPKENTYAMQICCGGGTYIRSIGRDIADALHTGAVMSALRRQKSGVFTLENSIPYSVLENDPPLEELEKYISPTESVLPFPVFTATEKDERMLFNGMTVFCNNPDGLYKVYQNDKFYGILQVENNRAKIKTKLC